MDLDWFNEHQRPFLKLVLKGMSNREIAEALGVEENYVKWNIWGAMRRLGVNNRVRLIRVLAGLDEPKLNEKYAEPVRYPHQYGRMGRFR